MGWIVVLFGFPFITVPSIVYGISAYILLPIGFFLSLFTGKLPEFRASLIAAKLIPTFLLLVVPLILYFYVWEPLGLAFFVWMVIYFLSRIYSGVHKREARIHEGWKEAKAIMEKRGKPGGKTNGK